MSGTDGANDASASVVIGYASFSTDAEHDADRVSRGRIDAPVGSDRRDQ
ncbi:hypothetical protein FHS97_000056 [Sphingomonas endophytica]|uniref:Resolvase/invertase-type recombinase catalytic domain-containing protein n=1 Tax=Sphingomonas endophytica TaxID=869719 RepID=A0ABR6N040_9SPHN|nr:hypothetical protein [Sphingomonas endophytica]MBB5724156.1 hypothetical protein [Sphingomonas endophytica]